MSRLTERFKNAWDAFKERDPTPPYEYGYGSYYMPGRFRLSNRNDRSIVTSIYNQIAVDCAAIDIRHVRLNEEGQYEKTIDDSLNYALTKSANIDQTARFFIRDAVLTMLDEGVVALVPVTCDVNPRKTDAYMVEEIRVGKIVEWFPADVLVEVYDQHTGQKAQLMVEKRFTAIVENPFYSIMNETNSTLQRLIRVLNQCDRTNEEISAGKMDLIVQLPYLVRSEAKKVQAEERRKRIEAQLSGNAQYGIAYIDGTEKVVQLNRPLENNLWVQAKELQEQLFNQLGFSKAIFDGTADEHTMLNYQNRTLEPILSAIVEEMERKWLSKTAITQRQAIRYFKTPFKLVPVAQLAEIADKFTRNCIMTSNEIRAVIGLEPSNDPKADQLINNNLNQPEEGENNEKVEIQNQ